MQERIWPGSCVEVWLVWTRLHFGVNFFFNDLMVLQLFMKVNLKFLMSSEEFRLCNKNFRSLCLPIRLKYACSRTTWVRICWHQYRIKSSILELHSSRFQSIGLWTRFYLDTTVALIKVNFRRPSLKTWFDMSESCKESCINFRTFLTRSYLDWTHISTMRLVHSWSLLKITTCQL